MSLDRQRITELLAAGTFDAFVGEVESQHFDAKSQAYDVNTDSGKRELAKDACAFANASGGHILIGLRTRQSPSRFVDEIEGLTLLTPDLINTTQYQDIIMSWCYPRIENVSVTFHPSADEPDRGLVAVDVPHQNGALRPFLLVRSSVGSRHIETAFGYVERKRDTNVSLDVRDLQRALRAGLNYEDNVATRFDRLEALIQQGHKRAEAAAAESGVVLEERISRALGER